MKRIIPIALFAIVAFVALSCGKEKDTPVTSISLSLTSAEMAAGEQLQLSATILPDGAAGKSVEWSSSKKSIASVDHTGLVTALTEGSATVTATAGGKSASCAITVNKANVRVTAIIIDKTELTLLKGESYTISAIVRPEDATDKTITWTSSDSNVASVENGFVLALSDGLAEIKAESGNCSATCKVVVLDAGGDGGATLSVGALSPDSPVNHYEGGEGALVVSGPSNWIAHVEDGEDWCHVTPSGDRLIVQTDRNDGLKVRSAVIMVASGKQRKYIDIYQAPQIRSIVPQKTRRIRLTQTVHYYNRSMSIIWIMLPYPETSDYQTISDLVIGDGGEIAYSKEGFLKYTSFSFKPTARTGTVVATIEYTATTNYVEVDFSKVTHFFDYDKTTAEYKRYTGISEIDGARYVDPENAVLGEVADSYWQETGGNIVQYCRKCYDYVATAFEYKSGGNGIVEDIIKNGGGDCGNIADLYLSMVRRKGIPARSLVMTQPHNDNHVRTEFYLAGYGWIPVDPTYHMSGSDEFGKFTDNWIVSNHELVSKVGVEDIEFYIEILQGCNWWWWCWSDGGDVTGEYDLSTI